jgi:putative addiction module component (TIGR02574 family)
LANAALPGTFLKMSPNAAQVLERALELSDDERTELLVRLLDMMPQAPQPVRGNETSRDSADIEAAWIAEARRRLQEIKAGRVEPAPWSEARARIFAREP